MLLGRYDLRIKHGKTGKNADTEKFTILFISHTSQSKEQVTFELLPHAGICFASPNKAFWEAHCKCWVQQAVKKGKHYTPVIPAFYRAWDSPLQLSRGTAITEAVLKKQGKMQWL